MREDVPLMILLFVFSVVFSAALSLLATEITIKHKCEKLGAFTIENEVFDCKKKAQQ